MTKTATHLLFGFLIGALGFLAAVRAQADQPIYAFNCGGTEFEDVEGNLFAADRAYQPGDGGYEGGGARAPAYVLNSAAWSCRDPGLHSRMREGAAAYRFDLPPGDYLLRLYWLEGIVHGPRLRRFDALAEGQPLVADLDLGETPGYMAAWERSFLVTVTDGTLDLEFTAARRASLLSAVAVWPAVDPGRAPAPPTGFVLRHGYGMNIITWDADHDPAHTLLRVYRAESALGPYAAVAELPAAQARYYDLDAPDGAMRHYRLATLDAWGRESAHTQARAATARHWSESSLDVFRLTMAQANLDSLNAHPTGDEELPALWTLNYGPTYSVDARYRGGMARYFRKKSWKIVLPGELNYLGFKALHLVANPDDIHVIKNEVSLRIFDELLPWSSGGRFVHLEFNGEYWGVYELVEEVDEDFLERRGVAPPGNLYKAYSDMRNLGSTQAFQLYYDQKTGDEIDHADLIEFVQGINDADAYALPSFLGERVDLDLFFDYYAMMVYTRQYDFISRNYYLYRDRDTTLWKLIPWDMNICFRWEELALDFGTQASPHTATGAWNRLIDRILSVPRLRLEYARRLETLHATVLNRDHLEPLVESIHDSLAVDAAMDVHKPWYENNVYLDEAVSTIVSRMYQRDNQLATLLPEFVAEIPTVCINEAQGVPGGPEETGRNEWSSWIELYNFGDTWVELSTLLLSPDEQLANAVPLPAYLLDAGERRLLYLDGRDDLGPMHLPLAPDPQGGTWVLMNSAGEIWDRVRYGVPDAGLSEGRHPDGWVTWRRMPMTPHRANLDLQAPTITEISLLPAEIGDDDSLRVSVAAQDPAGRPLSLSFHYGLAGGPSYPLTLAESAPGLWSGVAPPLGAPGELRWWVRAGNDLGLATHDPPGAPHYFHSVVLSAGQGALTLNEFMADNDAVIADEMGQFEDWAEIHSAAGDTLDLAGYGLSDDPAIPMKWLFPDDPAARIPPGGWLVVWADEDPLDGPLHANFKLSRTGETLLLSAPDGTLLDLVEFGAQATDVSFGREVDGALPWVVQALPSPGAANVGGVASMAGAPSFRAWPNPFNPRLRLDLALPRPGVARLVIYDLQGRLARELHRGFLPAGDHVFHWDGRDSSGRPSGSGIYFARLEIDGTRQTRKLLLLK